MKKIVTFMITIFTMVMTFGMSVLAAEYTVTETSATLYTNQEAVVYLDADVNMASTCILPSGMPIVVTGVTSNGFWQVDINNTTFYLVGNVLEATAESNTATQNERVYTLSNEDCWLYVLSTATKLRESLKNPNSLIMECCFGGSLVQDNKMWYVVNIGYYATNSYGGYVDDNYVSVFNLTDGKVVFGLDRVMKNIDFNKALGEYLRVSQQKDYYANYVTSYDTKIIKESMGY